MTKHGTAPSALFCRRRRRAQFYAGGGAFTHRPAAAEPANPGARGGGGCPAARTQQALGAADAGRRAIPRRRPPHPGVVRTGRADGTPGQRGEAGELRIAYTYSTPFTPLFASVINRYRQRYPGVVLTLNEMATLRQVDAIAAREIDLGFVRPAEAIAPATVRLTELRRDALLLVLPTGHALARQSSVAVSELKGLPFVMYPKDAGTGIYPQIFNLCRAAGFVPQVAMEVAEMSAILGLVAAGCGISVVPGSFNSLQMEGVVFRPLSDAAAHTPLLLAQREEAASPLVAAFVALVLEAAADGVSAAGAPANNSADGTAYDPAGDPADGPAGGRVSD